MKILMNKLVKKLILLRMNKIMFLCKKVVKNQNLDLFLSLRKIKLKKKN